MRLGLPESDLDEIRNLDLFKNLEEDHFRDLMQGAYVQNFPPHVDLIEEGDPPDFLHILISGVVDLFAKWNNRETSIGTARPVSTFILAATVRDMPYLMSARTIERSRIVLVPSQDVRAIFDIDNGFARAVVSELAGCYRASIKHSKDLKLRSSLERLANYLLRHQARAGGAQIFELECEKRRMAALLNMTPEYLSRAFKSLQPYGVVVSSNNVTIQNQTDLENFAKPNPLIDDPLT